MGTKCNKHNCLLNEDGIGYGCIIEDFYCKSQDIDDLKCEYCGAELVKVKGCQHEHFGFPYYEPDELRCPNKCLD